MAMADFNFIDSAARGYIFTWEKRRVLLRLALWPALIKLVSFTAIVALGLQDNVLRQGLVLLPSTFAEGWLAAVAVRMALLDEPWVAAYGPARDSVRAATATYVLIKLALAFIMGMAMLEASGVQGVQAPAPDIFTFIMAMLVLGGTVWAFRFTWLYVPVALGYRLRLFLDKIKPLMSSIHMLALWMLCFVPPALGLLLISEVLGRILPDGAAAYMYGLAAAQAIIELVIAIIAAVAMGYSVRNIMESR